MLNDVGTYVANESTEELNNNNNAPHQHGIDEKKREANNEVEFDGDDAIEDAGFISNTSHEFEAVQYRWVVLILFVLYSSSNAFQWTQLVIISNVIESYYNVSTVTVSWTSIIFMVTYIPLIFPASWFLYHKSLKSTIVIGACGTCLGSWIKLLSFYTSNPFVVVFIGQTVVATSQVFVLGLPAVLAAKWFPTHQVSTACAIGVFGNQLGVALGFVVPPFLVSLKDHDTGETLSEDEVGRDLYVMYLSVSIFTSLTLLGILIGFKSQPMHPPSFQQSQVRRSATARTALTEIHEDEDYPIQQSSFSDSIIQFGRDKNFITLLISYGLNVGVFYAISTILNPVVLIHFKDGQQDVGLIGLLMVVAGMFGSMLCGFILDRTHAYKTTTLVVYIFSFLGMIAFLFSLQSPQIHFVYIAAISLGFFMTGYLPLGFEFAAEITYPESEGTSSGLLNASAQFFGILCTLISEQVLHTFHDDRICNLFLVIILFVGSILTWSIKPDYRRNLAATRAQ